MYFDIDRTSSTTSKETQKLELASSKTLCERGLALCLQLQIYVVHLRATHGVVSLPKHTSVNYGGYLTPLSHLISKKPLE
jgi:hypothetical protein